MNSADIMETSYDEWIMRKDIAGMLNEHFLLNTLTAVLVLIRTNPELAAEAVKDFSVYLRGVIYQASYADSYMTLGGELSIVRAYLRIQNIRFQGRITCDMKIANVDVPVPPGAVRDVVESSVYKRIIKGTGDCHFYIEQETRNGKNIIIVRTEGSGSAEREVRLELPFRGGGKI